VKILDNQIQLTNKKIFRTLELALTEYMNNTKWTDEKVMPEERIECNLQIILSSYDVSTNNFQGTLQVQSTRPFMAPVTIQWCLTSLMKTSISITLSSSG
jgi:hypothetical protein